MDDSFCPNKASCKLVHNDCTSSSPAERDSYILQFCDAKNQNWENCKRLITKNMLGFCPDFVLPDSCMSLDEIIEEFDTN